MKSKFILLIIIFAMLSGCSMFAGEYTKTAVLNSQGEVVTNLFGMPVYNKSRVARSVSIVSHASKAAADANPSNATSGCNYLTSEQVTELSATGQGEYFRAVGSCQMMAMTTSVVDSAMNRPGSEAEAIMREASRAVQYSEDGMTKRVAAVANPLAVTVGIRARERTAQIQAQSNTSAIQTVAENGGSTTVGDITISQSQTAGADSNDGGSSGELGTGGDGSGVATNTKDGDTINLVIGDDNNSAFAEDDGRAFSGTTSTQQLDASANGNINAGGKQSGVNVADDLSGETTTDDRDGQNSLF